MGRIHLGTILGTTIAVDFSFIILIVFFIMRSYSDSKDMRVALLWAPVLFISVLVHEFAHAAMIAVFGYGSSQIVLGGMGGVTINDRKARPWQDMLISAAGPASSFLLAWVILKSFHHVPAAQRDPFFRELLPVLFGMNVFWGFFNLLPVMPLDGFGTFRHFLRTFLRENLAFVIAIWTSMITGLAVAIYGLTTQDLLLVFLMLWFVRDSWVQWDLYRSFHRPGD